VPVAVGVEVNVGVGVEVAVGVGLGVKLGGTNCVGVAGNVGLGGGVRPATVGEGVAMGVAVEGINRLDGAINSAANATQ